MPKPVLINPPPISAALLRYLRSVQSSHVLCQFTDANGRATLKDHRPFPGFTWLAGHRDSEGLLLLTDDSADRLT